MIEFDNLKLGFKDGFILSRIIKKLELKSFIKNNLKEEIKILTSALFEKYSNGNEKKKQLTENELKQSIIENAKNKVEKINDFESGLQSTILYVFSEIVTYIVEEIHQVEDDVCLLFERCTKIKSDEVDDINVLYTFLSKMFYLALPKMFSELFDVQDIKKNILK